MNFFDYIEDSNNYLSNRQKKAYEKIIILLETVQSNSSYIKIIRDFYSKQDKLFIEFLLKFNFNNLDDDSKIMLIIDIVEEFNNMDLNYKNKLKNILNIKC